MKILTFGIVYYNTFLRDLSYRMFGERVYTVSDFSKGIILNEIEFSVLVLNDVIQYDKEESGRNMYSTHLSLSEIIDLINPRALTKRKQYDIVEIDGVTYGIYDFNNRKALFIKIEEPNIWALVSRDTFDIDEDTTEKRKEFVNYIGKLERRLKERYNNCRLIRTVGSIYIENTGLLETEYQEVEISVRQTIISIPRN